jgi:hypothetical protein
LFDGLLQSIATKDSIVAALLLLKAGTHTLQ